MNSIFDYDYIEGSDHFEQIDQIEGRYRVVSGQQEVIEGMQCCLVKFSVKKIWPVAVCLCICGGGGHRWV